MIVEILNQMLSDKVTAAMHTVDNELKSELNAEIEAISQRLEEVSV